MRTSLITIFVLSVASVCAVGQHFNFKNYGPEEGLPQVQVLVIFQDKLGYIWLGTYAGASRFDGVGFETYDTSNGLKSNSVTGIAQDAQGRLYFATLGGGLSVFDGNSFAHYGVENGLLSDNIYALLVEDDGSVWLATDGGITLLRGGQKTHFTSQDGLDGEWGTAVYRSPEGELWAGTENGLFLLSGDEFVPYPLGDGIAYPGVNTIFQDGSGTLWIGTDSGLFRRVGSSVERIGPEQGVPVAAVTCAAMEKDGSLWFGSDAGAIRYSDGEFTLYTARNGLINDLVNKIYIDSENNIWFATERGISKLRRGPFIFYDSATGLVDDSVVDVFEDSRNRLWIATAGEGISVLEDGEFWSITAEDGLECLDVNSISEGPAGKIIIGTVENLSIWDGERVTVLDDSFGVSCLFRDSQKRVWIGSGYGVSIWDGVRLREPLKDNLLSRADINCIDEDDEGNIWFGTSGDGCIVYDGESAISYGKAEGLTDLDIWSIDVDEEGNVWIGTNGDGVFRYDGNTFVNYSKAQGLSNNFVWQVLADSKGNMWFGTNRALHKFDGVNFREYDIYDGLAANEGIQDACTEDRSGRLWFASDSGLSHYVASQPLPTDFRPPVYIRNFSVNGGALDLQRRHEIGPGQNTIVFNFIGLSYRNERAVRYRYKLEGLDSGWSAASPERAVRYANLPPGDYTFKVEAGSGEDRWSAAPAAVSFRVLLPFYQTYWFLALLTISIALLLMAAHLWRLRKIRRQTTLLEEIVLERTKEIATSNKELEAFIYSVSHDLRAPLRHIDGFSEIIIRDFKDNLSGEANKFLGRIRNSVKQMKRLIDDLLSLSRSSRVDIQSERFDLSLLVRVIGTELRQAEPDREVEFSIQDDLEAEGDENIIRLALENLLGNAWKFTRKKETAKIEFGAIRREGETVFFIKDNGVGFDMADHDKLFMAFQRLQNSTEFDGHGIGLATVERIIKRHGGRIWAEGEPEKGATFYFTL